MDGRKGIKGDRPETRDQLGIRGNVFNYKIVYDDKSRNHNSLSKKLTETAALAEVTVGL